MLLQQNTSFSKTFNFLDLIKIPEKAKRLFGIIHSLSQNEGYCWAGNEYLGEQLGCCVRNIGKLLVYLKKNEIIKIEYVRSHQGISRKIYINYEKIKEAIQKYDFIIEQKRKPIQEPSPIFYDEIQKIFKSCPAGHLRPAPPGMYIRHIDKTSLQGASNTIGDIEVLGKRTSSTALPASSKEQPKAKESPKPKKPEVKMQTHQTQKPPIHTPTKTPPPTPPPPAPEVKRPAKVIYQCLKDELFDQAEKEWITANYDEHTVKEAIKYVNSIVVKTTRLQALKYGCRNKKGEIKKAQSHADQDQAKKDANRRYAEKLVQKLPEQPHTGIDILTKGIEIYAQGASSKSIFISWAEHGFREQLHSALRKRGWRIPE